MTDQELIQFATEFRAGLLGKRSSARCCLVVCSPLATLLGLHGVAMELVESDLGKGRNHVWLRLADGRALDPTADQFATYPPVYLGPPKKIHRTDHAPPRDIVATPAKIALVEAAVAWIGESDRRAAQNARRRFARRVERESGGDPLRTIGVWSYAVGAARAIVAGHLEIRGDRFAATVTGARARMAAENL